jgi:hypothetical protein
VIRHTLRSDFHVFACLRHEVDVKLGWKKGTELIWLDQSHVDDDRLTFQQAGDGRRKPKEGCC